MFRTGKILAASAMFVVFSLAAAPHAEAEHIFFDADINGVQLGISAQAESLRADGAPTIISPTGDFAFTYRIYDDDSEPGGGVFNIVFVPTSTLITLPAPTAQTFTYDGTGTRANPVIFSFAEAYGIAGRWDGIMRTLITDGSSVRTRDLPFTIVSTVGVPEPTTMVLFGTGLASMAGAIRRRGKGHKS